MTTPGPHFYNRADLELAIPAPKPEHVAAAVRVVREHCGDDAGKVLDMLGLGE